MNQGAKDITLDLQVKWIKERKNNLSEEKIKIKKK